MRRIVRGDLVEHEFFEGEEMERKTWGALATAALIVAPTSAALAATQYPSEGGTWTYGSAWMQAYSYYTVNKNHGSTVKVDDRTSQSVCTSSGKKSIAELYDYPGSSKRYYYKLC